MTSIKKTRHGAARNSRPVSKIGGLPPLASQVLLHEHDVVASLSWHCTDEYKTASWPCQEQIIAGRCNATEPVYDAAQMRARPVFLPDMGEYFVSLRTARGWNQSQAADMAKRRGIQALTYNVLRWLEEGKTKNPEPDVLRAVATLYEIPYTEVVNRFIERRYGVSVEKSSASDVPSLIQPARGTFQVESGLEFRYVAMMKDRIAAGEPLVIDDANVTSGIAFSEKTTKKWKRPVCVRVGPREESMIEAGIMPNDLVVLETIEEARLNPRADRTYAVRVDGGSTLKKVERLQADDRVWLALIAENPDKRRYPTRLVPIAEGESILDYIAGRVEWKGQYL